MKSHGWQSTRTRLSADRSPGIGKNGRWTWPQALLTGWWLVVWLGVSPDAFAQALPNRVSAYRTDRILVKPREPELMRAVADLHQQIGAQVLRQFAKVRDWQVLQAPAGAEVETLLKRYRESELIESAEPDYNVSLLLEPNDFRYWDGSLWGLRNTGIYGGTPGADINAPEGWDMQCGAGNVIVAVIDTGVRYTHEDLAANMWVNPGETGLDALGRDKLTNGVDDDGDGYVDDVHGINTLAGSGDPNDDYGHGTHVAGTIGGVGNNGVGVVGVCWNVRLMACKFIDAQGYGSISDAITCIDYARSKGAKIINASWGDYAFTSAALRAAIDSVRDSGVIFVAACGNNALDNESNSLFPATYEYDNILAVAAMDRTDALAWFSNFGDYSVDLGAPGDVIFSCWNGSDSDYQYDSGTSMAAPHVAGACALAWSHYPAETHQQIVSRILRGAEPLPGLAGKCADGGRLDLPNALGLQFGPASNNTSWFDDGLPAGALLGTDGGDGWSWVTNNPAPYSGGAAHQSAVGQGIHYHSFERATETMAVQPGDTLFAYVYLDPGNPPREVMLAWNDGCWEHRAYWGVDAIDWGASQTSGRHDMGSLPPLGQWVRLEVPASLMKLEGGTLKGMAFVLVDGRATWDVAGRYAAGGSPP